MNHLSEVKMFSARNFHFRGRGVDRQSMIALSKYYMRDVLRNKILGHEN